MLGQTKCFVLLVADEAYLEQEAERKIGWLLKMIFAGTATFVAYQFFPYMGIVFFLKQMLCCSKLLLFWVFSLHGYLNSGSWMNHFF